MYVCVHVRLFVCVCYAPYVAFSLCNSVHYICYLCSFGNKS